MEDEFILALILVLIGIVLTEIIVLIKDWLRRRNEIQTIRGLLFHDFTRLHDLIAEYYQKTHAAGDLLWKDKSIADKIISGKESGFSVAINYSLNFGLNFWPAISNSGNLIKLELNEIQACQSTKEMLDLIDENVTLGNEEFDSKIQTLLKKNTEENVKRADVALAVLDFLNARRHTYQTAKEQMWPVLNLNWMENKKGIHFKSRS